MNKENNMTPKQKYDERKRLRAERMLRYERRAAHERDQNEDTYESLTRIMSAVERLADVMELWADMQGEQHDRT